MAYAKWDSRRVKPAQRRIIREMCSSLQKHLLSKMNDVPAHWDGRELRQWLADAADEQFVVKMDQKRMRSYRNDRIVHNL